MQWEHVCGLRVAGNSKEDIAKFKRSEAGLRKCGQSQYWCWQLTRAAKKQNSVIVGATDLRVEPQNWVQWQRKEKGKGTGRWKDSVWGGYINHGDQAKQEPFSSRSDEKLVAVVTMTKLGVHLLVGSRGGSYILSSVWCVWWVLCPTFPKMIIMYRCAPDKWIEWHPFYSQEWVIYNFVLCWGFEWEQLPRAHTFKYLVPSW